MDAQPVRIDGAAAERLFSPVAYSPCVLIGVSGGPDSLALLWLASQWSRIAGRPRIVAASVDHALRQSSAREALDVGAIAASLGVPHYILRWEGEKPATRLQERAREARYGLLTACAARVGADVLMTAHHADDQAETILFRLLRGSGVSGLAGMAPMVLRGGITHFRPLLNVPKADLVALCRDMELAFAEDPSNANERFARARLRKIAPLLEAEGLTREALLRLGARAARNDAAISELAARVREEIAAVSLPASFTANLACLRETSGEALLRIVLAEISRLCQSPRSPRLDRAEFLTDALLCALGDKKDFSSSLGGAVVRLDKAGRLLILREPPRVARQAPENGGAV